MNLEAKTNFVDSFLIKERFFMSNELMIPQELAPQKAAIAEYFRSGNVAQLDTMGKDFVLQKLCQRYDLDPILRPFELISFQGQSKFYLTASATNQLAAQKDLTREVLSLEIDTERNIAKCVVKVSAPSGRVETGSAYISLERFEQDKNAPGGIKKVTASGETLANALAKLETKAKRRVTMAFFGVPENSVEDESTMPESPRATVIESANTAANLAATSSPKLPEVPKESATPATTAPATEPAKRRGRQPKAEALTSEESAKVDAAVSAAQAAAPMVVTSEKVGAAIVDEFAAEPAPVAEKIEHVVYDKPAHGKFVAAAGDIIFGNTDWRTKAENAPTKNTIIAALPSLHGKVNVCIKGSDIPCDEFVSAIKGILAKNGMAV